MIHKKLLDRSQKMMSGRMRQSSMMTNMRVGSAMVRPRFVDLFCGAGLLSHSFKSSGFKPLLAVDVDAKAVRSYRRNIAKCAQVADVRVVPDDLSADVIIAGPPCQGFSTLGRRDPLDARNELGLSVVNWAEKLSPQVVVIENVPNFLNSAWFNTIKERLISLGYEIQIFVLDAEDFGVAQRRRRAFTIASKIGSVDTPKPRMSKARTFRDVVLNRPVHECDPMHTWPIPSELALERFSHIPLGGGKDSLINNRPDLCPPSWFKIRGQATDVWSRIAPDSPTNTIRCAFQNPSKGRYIHPFEDRVLSLREAARLQGIPDSWLMYGEPYPIARQIGNGVPIPLGRAIAKRVLEAIARYHCDAPSVQFEAA